MMEDRLPDEEALKNDICLVFANNGGLERGKVNKAIEEIIALFEPKLDAQDKKSSQATAREIFTMVAEWLDDHTNMDDDTIMTDSIEAEALLKDIEQKFLED